MYLNERVDAVTDAPLGMQINGVPFEYKVTETPQEGTIELWKIINLTVDAHPMHPHLVKHQRVGFQELNVGLYKQALCGSTTCQPGTAPGMEMQVVPDVDSPDPLSAQSFYTGPFVAQSPTGYDSGYKDASVALPGYVTSIIAEWKATWPQAASAAVATAPGGGAGVTDLDTCIASGGTALGCSHTASPWVFEPVTTGPYVWHCHINSHEDSEMMRTSLVVPASP
jgi:FtsP/CotA-like multicopper oxidase with cupredoxin domain